MNRLRRSVWLCSLAFLVLLVGAPVRAQFPPAPGTGPGFPETIEAIDAAGVTTRILYVTAHPDDESSAVLTYLARGLHADVALLSITRGEGGQNALGPEQAPQLGLIRTQELLAATRGYGVKLYFTRAPDFGYSKTPEETMRVWGDQVLDDMVRVIRTFRPHIVINNFGGVHWGHGHHQAAGILTPKAVQMAGDEKAFPGQLKDGLSTWGGGSNPVQILDLDRSEKPKGYILPLDDVSPLWGKTWREIGLDAFANHRTQGIAGFLGSPFLRRPIALVREDGGKFDPATLAQPLHTINTVEMGVACGASTFSCSFLRDAEGEILAARTATLSLDWRKAEEALGRVRKDIPLPVSRRGDVLSSSQDPLYYELGSIRERINHALILVAGVRLTAEADRDELVAGESFGLTAQARCRPEAGCTLGQVRLELPPGMSETKHEGDASAGFQLAVAVKEPAPRLTAWDLLQPEPPPLVVAQQTVSVAGNVLAVRAPVMHIAATSTRADKVPLRIVPAYTLAVQPEQAIEVLGKPRKPFDVHLRVHSYATQPSKVEVGLTVPHGWTFGAPVSLEFTGAGDRYARFTVAPPEKLETGTYTLAAYAQRGGEKFTTSLEPIPSLPTQLWSEAAECRVRAVDISVPENLRVGYISAEDEPIPEALGRLGIRVEMLDADSLAFSDLSRFDAIVVGVRAYELRSDLAAVNQRLLDYVSAGGTLLVQYERDYVWERLKPAPYPATIGNPTPRITDETAAVRLLEPDDPLLSAPNKITADDFNGWVQERGLYYWSQFDPHYTALLAMHDPGEKDLDGGLVYVRYGKGTYIYTGLAFFRQLPESVPGAYRLFVNLLAASRPR